MHRLFLATFITTFALHADTFTLTSCTSGTTTISPCGGTYISPRGLPNAMAGASASDTGLVDGVAPYPLPPIPDGWTMSTGAGVGAFSVGPSDPPASATANASAFDTFFTTGPVRNGLIQFNVTVGQAHGGDATVVLTDGTNTYKYDVLGGGSAPPFITCTDELCAWASTAPFDLGVQFNVNAFSAADRTVVPGGGGGTNGSAGVVTFRLLEADGTTPVPFSVIPEPSTWGLLLLGLGACGRLVWTRRIKHF